MRRSIAPAHAQSAPEEMSRVVMNSLSRLRKINPRGSAPRSWYLRAAVGTETLSSISASRFMQRANPDEAVGGNRIA
jgi:hypothetical protein